MFVRHDVDVQYPTAAITVLGKTVWNTFDQLLPRRANEMAIIDQGRCCTFSACDKPSVVILLTALGGRRPSVSDEDTKEELPVMQEIKVRPDQYKKLQQIAASLEASFKTMNGGSGTRE